MVMYVLFDIFQCVVVSTKKDALVHFLTDPTEVRSTLRPGDILVFRWVGGKHTCLDLTKVSHHMGSRDEGLRRGRML